MPISNIPSPPSVQDALGAVEQGGPSVQGLAFPANLDKHFILFKVKKRERSSKLTAPSTNVKSVISLPVPAALSTGYNAKYANMPIGPAGALAQQVAAGESALTSVSDMLSTESGKESLKGAIKNVGAALAQEQLSTVIGGAIGGIAGAVAGEAAGQGLQGTLQTAGVARNPHLAVLFEGVDMRTHQFNYKLIPKNEGESATLQDIIKQFKLAMAPEFIESGHFFNYPDEFDIEFSNTSYLFKIGTSVLTDFQVNYTAQDGSLFHSNRAPVAVSISMTFQELDIITKKQIEAGR
jgi:hypothetical protein